MKIIINLHPTPADGSTGGTTPSGKPKHKPSMPVADSDFLATHRLVANTWLATPAITLIWANATDFNTMVGDYGTALGERRSAGGDRPSNTNTLETLDAKIEEAVIEVKTYIEGKFKKKNAPSEFPRYGMVHRYQRYQLPYDRQERFDSLDMMIAAIATDGFGANDFGTAFWTAMKADYKAAMKAAVDTDSKVSSKVSSKGQLKKDIQKIAVALRLVIRGNYPETYKAVYREWGWQKEDY